MECRSASTDQRGSKEEMGEEEESGKAKVSLLIIRKPESFSLFRDGRNDFGRALDKFTDTHPFTGHPDAFQCASST